MFLPLVCPLAAAFPSQPCPSPSGRLHRTWTRPPRRSVSRQSAPAPRTSINHAGGGAGKTELMHLCSPRWGHLKGRASEGGRRRFCDVLYGLLINPMMSSGFKLHDLTAFLWRFSWSGDLYAGPPVSSVTARRLGFCPVKGSSVRSRAADNIDIHAFCPHGGAAGASSLARRSSHRPWEQVKREDARVAGDKRAVRGPCPTAENICVSPPPLGLVETSGAVLRGGRKPALAVVTERDAELVLLQLEQISSRLHVLASQPAN